MLSIPLFTNLYVQVMYVSNTIEWNRKLIVIYEVLTFVMVPTQCQHLSIDSYLEEGTDGSYRQPCESFFSFCYGRVNIQAGKLKKMPW